MSYGYRNRVQNTTFIWDTMTEAEKKDIMGWCPISDQVIRQQYPNVRDIDAIVAKMSDAELASLHRLVMDIYRKKRTARYLRQEGRTSQAEKLEKEVEKEEEQLEEMEVVQ